MNYTRAIRSRLRRLPYNVFTATRNLVEGEGFEPSKAVPSDLQSDPFGHSGTPPGIPIYCILPVSFARPERPRILPTWPAFCKPRSPCLPTWPLRKWCWLWDSNSRPTDYKSVALPTELSQHRTAVPANGLNAAASILIRRAPARASRKRGANSTVPLPPAQCHCMKQVPDFARDWAFFRQSSAATGEFVAQSESARYR